MPVAALSRWLTAGSGAPRAEVNALARAQCVQRRAWRGGTVRSSWFTHPRRAGALRAAYSCRYTLLFMCFAGVTPTGLAAVGLAGVLVVEAGLTLYDFVTEDGTRWRFAAGLPATERVTHTLLTLNYGALLALWLPVMLGPAGWASLPTGIHLTSYGWLSAFNAVAGVGVGAWAVRDYFSTKRLQRFAAAAVQSPPRLGLVLPAQRVLVTGGTGFIGTRLVGCLLREGHQVTLLCRDRVAAARIIGAGSGAGGAGALTLVESLDAVPHLGSGPTFDVVFNLAGESLAAGRWSPARQARLFASRLDTTRAVVQFLQHDCAQGADGVRPVLVSASAVGFYGVVPPGAELPEVVAAGGADETTTPFETGSLSHRLCARWEAEAGEAATAGVRVVTPRIGVVLGRDGGALGSMLPPFEFGLGGPLGSGEQVCMPVLVKLQCAHVPPKPTPLCCAADHALDTCGRPAACLCAMCQRWRAVGAGERHRAIRLHQRRVQCRSRSRATAPYGSTRAGCGLEDDARATVCHGAAVEWPRHPACQAPATRAETRTFGRR